MTGAPAALRGWPAWLVETLRILFVTGVALACGFALTCTISADPVTAYASLLTGGLPDLSVEHGTLVIRRITRLGAVLEDATTLTFLGLAVAIPFRTRQFSLGADGQMFLGALAAAATSIAVGGPAILVLPLAGLAAVLTGFAYGWIPGVLKARFGASEIVTTLMLNIVAVQAYRLIIAQVMRVPGGTVMTPPLPDSAMLPLMIGRTHVTALLFVAIGAAVAAWFFLMRTTAGYALRVVGDNPLFAEQAGIDVKRSIALAIAIGGGFAGLAGFHLSNALLNQLPMTLAPGLGFDGIVVALLARNEPRAIPLAALFYAYLRVGAQVMERNTDVAREMVLIIQALLILLVVADRFLPQLVAGVRRLVPGGRPS